MKNKDLKPKVTSFVKKNARVVYPLVIIPIIINGVLSAISGDNLLLSSLELLVASLLAVIVPVVFLALSREEEFSFQKHIIENMKTHGLAYIFLSLLQFIYLFLWTLLLVVPGLIKSMAYSFAPFIQYDNPKMRANAVIKESIRLTNGKKASLFRLYFSYYVWAFIALFLALVFTIGAVYGMVIGMLFFGPGVMFYLLAGLAGISYIAFFVLSIRALPRWNASLAHLYEDWKNEDEK